MVLYNSAARNTWHMDKHLGRMWRSRCSLYGLPKYFGSVTLQRLIMKLESKGVKGRVLHWVKDFLTNRHQNLIINGSISIFFFFFPYIPVMDPMFVPVLVYKFQLTLFIFQIQNLKYIEMGTGSMSHVKVCVCVCVCRSPAIPR